ncbi:uncharacterized protein LOC107472304 [Arachis duranensis]|uniref:Uncharacterized protein LOC107472304 n=1 Tax=Arachis duranensis TaxID=130453 RepID=A0A6P4CAJ9_ARADU|nr:uncharacterized protein LOC107472304 [Arachis duranensis]
MRKKVVHQKPPREKLLIFPSKPKPSTRSRDQTFTPSLSPPTSPPHTNPMARTKTTPRYPSPTKPTPPPKEPPSKSSSSKPSSSKGKGPVAAKEPVPESTQPKPRSVPTHPQRGQPCISLKSVEEPDIDPFVKGRDIVLNNETISDSLKYTDVGACAYASVIDDDDESVPEDSPPPSTEGTSVSTRQNSTLFGVVKNVIQEFFSQSNHMIVMSKEHRKLASKYENFLRKSRERVAIFMKFIDNLQADENAVTDTEEENSSEEDGSDV